MKNEGDEGVRVDVERLSHAPNLAVTGVAETGVVGAGGVMGLLVSAPLV